jgi:hypothetical protein
MIFRSDKGQGAQCESATLPSTHTPEGATDKAVNIHLDKLITQREPVNYEATWVQQRYWATRYSTVRAWLLRQ